MSDNVVPEGEEENGHIDLGSVTGDIAEIQQHTRTVVDRRGDGTH